MIEGKLLILQGSDLKDEHKDLSFNDVQSSHFNNEGGALRDLAANAALIVFVDDRGDNHSVPRKVMKDRYLLSCLVNEAGLRAARPDGPAIIEAMKRS